jgi:hypothetical protein
LALALTKKLKEKDAIKLETREDLMSRKNSVIKKEG